MLSLLSVFVLFFRVFWVLDRGRRGKGRRGKKVKALTSLSIFLSLSCSSVSWKTNLVFCFSRENFHFSKWVTMNVMRRLKSIASGRISVSSDNVILIFFLKFKLICFFLEL